MQINDDINFKSKSNGSLKKPRKAIATANPTEASFEIRKQRDAVRKQMMEERRKAMKAQKQAPQNIEIFVPESS